MSNSAPTAMPKRLMLLLALLSVLATGGLWLNWLPLLWVLVLLLVLGCVGRQKAGLMLLRLLGMAGLALFITLPFMPTQVAEQFADTPAQLPYILTGLSSTTMWLISAAGALLCGFTLWVAFTQITAQFFRPQMRFNILG
ncbi:MAG: hypothetical protein LPD71_12870 [Shewanella sp.]|nr:hypothetical protein [Shewanella sp.]MCF1439589.1 hypothetical protein [Shewanella sp.]